MVATSVPVQDLLSEGILSSSTTCGILGCSEGSTACYHQLVVIFLMFLILPSTLRIFIHHQMVAMKNEKLEKSKKT